MQPGNIDNDVSERATASIFKVEVVGEQRSWQQHIFLRHVFPENILRDKNAGEMKATLERELTRLDWLSPRLSLGIQFPKFPAQHRGPFQ
jgi:hypothetical protein